MKTQEYNKGVSFRVPTIGFRSLCRVVKNIPGVVFTQRRKFFWSGEDVGAEFSFRGSAFTITTDGWDGALWIMTKDLGYHPDEMQVLRSAVEGAATERGFLCSLWRRLMTETFT